MKSALTALLFVLCAAPASATTMENVLFTCDGELQRDGKGYTLYQSWIKQEDLPMTCYIDNQKVVRKILAVCRVGDVCVVSAKGASGNGNRHVIQKVFAVQRLPMKVRDLTDE